MSEPSPPSIAEEMVMALALQLHRKGLLDLDDLAAAADTLLRRAALASSDEAQMLEMAAHLLTTVPVEAEAPDQSEWNAQQARARLRLVRGDDQA